MFSVEFHPGPDASRPAAVGQMVSGLQALLNNPAAFYSKPVAYITETLVGHVSYICEGTAITIPVMVCAEAENYKLVPYSLTEVIEDVHTRFLKRFGGDITSLTLKCIQGETSKALEGVLTEVFQQATLTSQPSSILQRKGQILLDLKDPVTFVVKTVGLNDQRRMTTTFGFDQDRFTVGSVAWAAVPSGPMTIRQLWAAAAIMKSYCQ